MISEETRQKMRENRLGKKWSKEIKEKISKRLKGKPKSKEFREHLKKISIFCTDKNPHLTHPETWLGENHWNWKQGRSNFIRRLRSSRQIASWRNFIYERDGYKCRECGCDEKALLEAHHIKEFSKIMTDFLNKYPELSPLNDISVLVQLAYKYKDFWDVNNGITLCIPCHKEKEHNWGKFTKNLSEN